MSVFSIAIDGPAGAGKSTVAKAVAERLGAVYLDTGAMYRTFGLYMDRHSLTTRDQIAAAANAPRIEVEFIGGEQRMRLDGEDVTDALRTPDASKLASQVAAVAEIRERLVKLQRDFAVGHSVVMDGRDIGTDVLPDATLKVFLTASCETRAERRFKELTAKGEEATYDQVLKEIIDRDYRDAHREVSPMRQAPDAVRVDTSALSIEQSVDAVAELAREAIARKA